ncbi:MAG: glycosyltransferase family 1 protein [Methylophilaceae bacterium]
MHIVQFVHPDFLNSQSMPRFARMITEEMRTRGHCVDEWTAAPLAYRLPVPARFKKWLGYIDQFIIFPIQVRWRLRKLPSNTLFVFADQALGPWVPVVASRPHVVHVHDFMALRSSLGEFPQNPTGWTGQQYQALIRRGFGHGRYFVSVSENTRSDLHRFLPGLPEVSEVVYNGLNYPFRSMTQPEYEAALSSVGLPLPATGFLLHVGGNQWYKNREGVLEIYEAYVRQTVNPLPLWIVGASPSDRMKDIAQRVTGKGDVWFLSGLSDKQVCAAYSAARLMLFPSLAEGFGWPIAEAMACGCLVLTTGQAPMTEVGGDAAFYIPTKPVHGSGVWATHAGERVAEILALSPDEVGSQRQKGYEQVAQFDAEQTLDAYERIYQQALAKAVP